MGKKAAREKGKHHHIKVRLVWLLAALFGTSLLLGCIPPPSRLTQMTQDDPGQIDQAETGQIYFKKTEAKHIAFDSRSGLTFSDNELLVAGKDGSSYQAMEALAKEYGAKIVGYIEVTNDYQWQFSNSASKTELDDLIALLSLNELVEEVTLNLLAEYEPTYVPSQDTEWPADSFDESYPEGNNWGVEAVGAIEAWNLRDEMTPIRVGLIDTGFDAAGQVNQDRAGYSASDLAYTGHEDLDFAATFFNPPRSLDDPMKSERDHGTHVAGTFAAGFDNGRGITGLYPHAAGNLYGVSIRGMESSGYLSGQARNFMSSVAYKTAFAELVARNVKVINVSMGYRDDIVFAAQRGNSRAIDLIRSNASILAGFLGRLLRNGYDFVIVVAAGNTSDTAFEETSDLERFPYGWRRSSLEGAGLKVRCSPIYSNGLIFTAHPTVSERVIAVGSARVKHQKNGEFSYILSKFSNAGSGLDLVAPGEEIHSCIPGGYDEKQGTSMAAPHVTGIAAMVWSYNPSLTGPEVKKILIKSAEDEVSGCDKRLVNASRALELAAGDGSPQDDPQILNKNDGILISTLVDSSDESTLIVGAKVEARSKGKPVSWLTTGQDGRFELPLLAGRYHLKVTAEGYEDWELKNIEVKAGEVTHLDPISLQRKASSPTSSVSEDDLRALLKAATSGKILEFHYADFDGDGEAEAFAFVGEKIDADGGAIAELWFISKDGARHIPVESPMGGTGFYFPAKLWSLEKIKMLHIVEGYGGSGSQAHAWIVKDGQPHKLDHLGAGLNHAGGNDFWTSHSTFDAMSDGTGHTWKRYYLFFDGDRFREYGGIEITENQFAAAKGGAELLEDIESGGNRITDIFYRSNEIININFTDGRHNGNVTVKLTGNKIEFMTLTGRSEDKEWKNTDMGGVYKAALFPDIAVYPSRFPLQ